MEQNQQKIYYININRFLNVFLFLPHKKKKEAKKKIGGFMKFFYLIIFVFLANIAFGVEPDLLEELNLTKDQQKKIEEIIFSYESKRTDLELKLQIKHLEIRQLLFQDDINPELVKTKLEELSKIEVELRYSLLMMDVEIIKNLNKDQKDKYRIVRGRFKKFRNGSMMHKKGMMLEEKDEF